MPCTTFKNFNLGHKWAELCDMQAPTAHKVLQLSELEMF